MEGKVSDGSSAELHLFLGRLDGKMDMVLANQSTIGARMDRHETRLETLEKDAAKTDGSVGVGKQAFTWLLSALALVVSAYSYLSKGLGH